VSFSYVLVLKLHDYFYYIITLFIMMYAPEKITTIRIFISMNI